MSTSTEIREKPILFSTDMIKAILSGNKRMTRRIIKPQPQINENQPTSVFDMGDWNLFIQQGRQEYYSWSTFIRNNCPYGQVGDRLWVRETFRYMGEQHETGGKVWIGAEPPLSTTQM